MAENNITCKVLFFASAAEATGQREQTVEVALGATVAELFAILSSESPALQQLQKICAFAIEEKLVHADTEITESCTIAVLPPVSGG
ncbi:MAG: molybdopterin converting factor subunit 1 [Planctomycetes bacterium]|nr:molybdopterin converting factor subunit 1 [Planctomycetota bacterium]